jgi:4-hydroxythreonine-4-phosphate dehydrogenase
MSHPPSDGRRPILALAIGDPAGVGPELAAKALADPEVRAAADLILVGDRRVLARGAEVAGVELDLASCRSVEELGDRPGTVLVDLGHLDPASIEIGVASRAGGEFALRNFRTCIELAAAGRAGAVCFTPFNKAAMRMTHPSYDDEIGYGREVLGSGGPTSEFNILEGLWNARVTSHVPLSAVAGLITKEAVLKGIRLTHDSLREAGYERPRIAVAGLNPHAGDGGNFGQEEIEIIEPAVEVAKQEGLDADGPYPPDTVFLRASKGAFDAVLTMYHDQGQIAIKLLGFDQGVTLIGGMLPFPITTPAHGTAYDIAGRGIANPEPTWRAFDIACRLVEGRSVARAA